MVEGNPPTVWVGQDMKVKASDSVTLEGFYNTSEVPTNVEWSSSQEPGVFRRKGSVATNGVFVGPNS